MAENAILLVGEGNFSFAASFIQNVKEHLIASCFSDKPLSLNQKTYVEIIHRYGGEVFTDVDACEMDKHPKLKNKRILKIIFNFPHIEDKMNIRDNRRLLKKFFISAEKVLFPGGEVWVTLCDGQGGTLADDNLREWCNSWQVVAMAAYGNFALHRVKPFVSIHYPGYKCSGYRGQDISFNLESAKTHIFIRKDLEVLTKLMTFPETCLLPVILSGCQFLIPNYYAKKLKRNVLFQTDHPYYKMLTLLKNAILKSTNSSQVIYCDVWPVQLSDDQRNKLCKSHHGTTEKNSALILCPDIRFSKNAFNIINDKLNGATEVAVGVGQSFKQQSLSLNFLPIEHKAILYCRNVKTLLDNIVYILGGILKFPSNNIHFIKNKLDDLDINVFDTNDDLLLDSNCTDISTGSRVLITDDQEKFDVKECPVNIFLQSNDSKDMCNAYDEIIDAQIHGYIILDIANKNKVLKDQRLKDIPLFMDSKHLQKVAEIYTLQTESCKLACISLSLDKLCMIKYCFQDWRLIWSDNSHLQYDAESDSLTFVSDSLYPPYYIHDISFWIREPFCEQSFFTQIKYLIGDIVFHIYMIDEYHDVVTKKISRCYRLLYQSQDEPLSLENSKIIQLKIREYLEIELHFVLR